jgi:dethiobiotin synthetase
MSLSLPYAQINPVALLEPIAPHIAAARAGLRLDIAHLADVCRAVLAKGADFTLLEGAGGWRVPLNATEYLSALAVELQLPVVLVVGMRLGCINHSLLTAEAIARDGLTLAGWVANRCMATLACYEENIAALRAALRAPCLGEVPHLDAPAPARVAAYLDCGPLVG